MSCSAVRLACYYSPGQDSLYQCVRGKFEKIESESYFCKYMDISKYINDKNGSRIILIKRFFVLPCQTATTEYEYFNPLNPEFNPICYLLALLGAHHFLHVSRIRVKLLTSRHLMSYIYGAPILDVSRSHTTTQHSR